MTWEVRLQNTAIKYQQALLLQLFLGLKDGVLEFMNFRAGVQWKESFDKLFGDAEMRPYTGSLTTDASFNARGRELEVFLGQSVAQEDPRTLQKIINNYAKLNDNKTTSKHPLEAQMLAIMVNRNSRNFRRTIFNAVRNGAGTTTADLYDGFDTITAAEVAGGGLSVGNNNYMSLGTVDSTNAVDKLMGIYEGSSDELQEEDVNLYIPRAVYNLYNRNYRDEFGASPYNTEFKKTYLEGTDDRWALVPMQGKFGSPYIHATKRENMLVGTNGASDLEFIEVRRGDNPFKHQFIQCASFGVQFESIEASDLMVAEIDPIS